MECQWKRKKSQDSVKSVATLFPVPEKKRTYSAIAREPHQQDRDLLYSELKSYGRFTGVCWLLSPEPEPPSPLPIKTVEDIFSEGFLQQPTSEKQFLMDEVRLAQNTIRKVSTLTSGQRDNPAWHLARKGRLTASNFGVVFNAKRITPSLMKRLLGDKDLSGVRAIAWGVDNEDMALKTFTKATGIVPTPIGLWLHKSGVIGASLDGLVGTDAVLEVKCPYTHRNGTITDAVKSSQFCLEMKDGNFALKTTHPYWHQIQGQMFLTQRLYCFFTVSTPKQTVVLKIARDASWQPNIDILTDFYFHKLFPKIIEL